MFPYGNIRRIGVKFVKFHIAALMIFSDHIITFLAPLTSDDRVWSAFELFFGYLMNHESYLMNHLAIIVTCYNTRNAKRNRNDAKLNVTTVAMKLFTGILLLLDTEKPFGRGVGGATAPHPKDLRN